MILKYLYLNKKQEAVVIRDHRDQSDILLTFVNFRPNLVDSVLYVDNRCGVEP